MTRERTWRAGTRFYKRVNDPEEAERLIACAHRIARAGANTPQPEYCPAQTVLRFPAIEGATGVALLDDATLSELLVPLRAIRRARVPGLPILDPLAKVTARLGPDTPQWLTSRVACLENMALDAGGIVHGDFHCGQLIRDRANRVWVIDLEDMAQGPVEADLGNFAAHLATRPETLAGTLPETRPETRRGDLAEGVRLWTERILAAWDQLGEPCDPALFWRHVDIALIRRALKLHIDRGEPEVLAALERLPLFS